MRHSESWLRPVKVWFPTESKLQLKVWKCSDRDPTMWRSVSAANRKGRIAAATHEHLKIPERFVNTVALSLPQLTLTNLSLGLIIQRKQLCGKL